MGDAAARVLGRRSEPWRARPVPFCRYGFLPPPRTWPRVLAECVPCLAAACCATTTWWISGTFTLAAKISSGSSTVLLSWPDGEMTLTAVIGLPPFRVLAALRTSTTRPLGPGTAPLIRSSPRSASTECTVSDCTVVRTPPIRPAIRTPLNTRPGVAHAPMEPGERCLRWVPCEERGP